jgi:hypothetical protein
MSNSFLNIESDLEKLNKLKTELCVVLDDISIRNNKESDLCFLELQAGNYYLLNKDEEIVYEGKWFDNDYLIAEGYTPPELNKINDSPVEENLEWLLNKKKELNEELSLINKKIVDNFFNSMEVFDTSIEQIELMRDTWRERLQDMLEGITEIEEDTISVFQEVVTTLKKLVEKVVSVT